MKKFCILFVSLVLSARVASAQTDTTSSPETQDTPPSQTDTAASAPEPALAPAAPASGNEVPGAAAKAPDDATSKDVARDQSLAALGVGEYGKRSEMFVLWENANTGAYIKPIVWISGSLLGYFPNPVGDASYADRPATLLVTRFGFEGALTDWVSFKLELQRDLGFSLASNGPQGTGVFEGTASLQARENYVSVHKWGLNVTAGIQTDPASVDFITPNVLGMFGMDPFTRDYLLNSGFNLGQGVMLRYTEPFLKTVGAGQLTFGFSFQSGNPLTTSLSYSFGGNVTQNGTLYTAPIRTIINGLPGTNIALQTYSPSLVYSVDFAKGFGLDVRAMAQFQHADPDATTSTDATINGVNYRGTMRVRLPHVNLMGGYARRVNQQIAIPDLTRRLGDNNEGTVWSLGGDFTWDKFSVGAHYAYVNNEIRDSPHSYTTAKYLNIGASYQLVPSFLSTQLRFANVKNKFENVTAIPVDATMIVASLVLTI